MKVLRQLSITALLKHQAAGYRITIKVIFRNRKGELLLCTSGTVKKHHKKKANIPGGGINLPQEGKVQGTFREVGEEMFHRFKQLRRLIRKGRVLAEGKVPTTRKGFVGKYLVIILVDVPDFDGVRPKSQELANFTILKNPKCATGWLDTMTVTDPAVLELMKSAVLAICDTDKVIAKSRKRKCK